MRLRTKGPWTILAAAFAFVVLLTGACSSGAPPPQENDPAPAPTREGSSDVADASGPPLGDCYGGVFAIEPMHCYMLEQAEAEGVFDIEAIFENKKDGLTIYVPQDEFSDETGTFITQKATEFFGSWPDLIPSRTYSRASAKYSCRGDSNFCPEVWLYGNDNYFYLKLHREYGHVQLYTGGVASRRSSSGWASWPQLWPEVRNTRSTLSITDFRVPKVSTLIPDSCSGHDPLALSISNSCWSWRDYPESGVLAYYIGSGPDESATQKIFLQVKKPPGNESHLMQLKERIGETPLGRGLEIVEVPVKYSYIQLWRWATILNRFTYWEGNTIGLVSAYVDDNIDPRGLDLVWPNQQIQPIQFQEMHPRTSDIRDGLKLAVHDPDLFLVSMPALLLRHLGIPTDAIINLTQKSSISDPFAVIQLSG